MFFLPEYPNQRPSIAFALVYAVTFTLRKMAFYTIFHDDGQLKSKKAFSKLLYIFWAKFYPTNFWTKLNTPHLRHCISAALQDFQRKRVSRTSAKCAADAALCWSRGSSPVAFCWHRSGENPWCESCRRAVTRKIAFKFAHWSLQMTKDRKG